MWCEINALFIHIGIKPNKNNALGTLRVPIIKADNYIGFLDFWQGSSVNCTAIDSLNLEVPMGSKTFNGITVSEEKNSNATTDKVL